MLHSLRIPQPTNLGSYLIAGGLRIPVSTLRRAIPSHPALISFGDQIRSGPDSLAIADAIVPKLMEKFADNKIVIRQVAA